MPEDEMEVSGASGSGLCLSGFEGVSVLVKAARIPLANDFLALRTGWNFTSFTKGLSRSYPLFRM